MRRFLVAVAFGLAAIGAGAAVTPSVPQSVPQIQEDDPSWDCRTMGNRVCGPTYPAYLSPDRSTYQMPLEGILFNRAD